jgi:hypothetical protein
VEVSREGVLEEVLARPVEPLPLRHLRPLAKGPPGELVNGGVGHPPGVGKEKDDVVPDMEDAGIQEKAPLDLLHHLLYRGQHRRARQGVPAHGTDIRLEYA